MTLARAGGTHDGSESGLVPVGIRTRVFVEMFGGQPEVYADHSPWSLVRRGAVQLQTELSVRIIIGTADGLWNANQLFVWVSTVGCSPTTSRRTGPSCQG